MQNSRTVAPLIAMLIACLTAGRTDASTLYKCTDDTGHATYATSKAGLRNCTVISEERSTPATKPRPVAASSATAAGFPRVSKDQQRNRDSDRRYLLDQEFKSEQKNLEDARKSLAEPDAVRLPAAGQQALRDRVALHERNLDALRREMSALK
ncbi:MAG: hypothetical protein M0P39_11330 [Rhodocyclaceae bacterium]|nr:hypothetical protein [Rhodocyclaceae bacterium]